MKVGTKSLLFGVHQFLWHPLMVYLAWVKLYGWPTLKETICIIIHDWGYWGKPNMDGDEGGSHPEVGARIALKLFGPEYEALCLYHSRNYASLAGAEPSKLCLPDKLSIKHEKRKFYLLRAKLSGEIKEYRERASNDKNVDISEPDSVWFDWISSRCANERYGHKLNINFNSQP